MKLSLFSKELSFFLEIIEYPEINFFSIKYFIEYTLFFNLFRISHSSNSFRRKLRV